MKRFVRFIKWCFSDMGWFEWYMLGTSFCLGAGLTSMLQGNEELRKFWFGSTILFVMLFLITFVLKGIIHAWQRFKEQDDKVFNILKQEEVK